MKNLLVLTIAMLQFDTTFATPATLENHPYTRYIIDAGGASPENLDKCARALVNKLIKYSKFPDIKIDGPFYDNTDFLEIENATTPNLKSFIFMTIDKDKNNFSGEFNFKYTIREIKKTFSLRTGEVKTPAREELTCTNHRMIEASEPTAIKNNCLWGESTDGTGYEAFSNNFFNYLKITNASGQEIIKKGVWKQKSRLCIDFGFFSF